MNAKKSLQGLILAASFISAVSFAQQVMGSGSSFAYPGLSQWTQDYANKTGNQINYQPIGSGNGLRQLSSNIVDFAVSDMPLSANQLNQQNLLQFPILTGAIVPVVNIAGIQNNQLVLNATVLADIYMDKVSKWNDPEIRALNPGLNLPNALIISVHRSDSSGTTYNFTQYLSALSPAWKNAIGANLVVAWPGYGLGVKGNAGMVSQVQNMPNSIGYVAYAYAKQNDMTMVKLQNQAGQTVAASTQSFSAELKNANSAQSWPIMATSFVLVPNHNSKYAKDSPQVLKFFDWVYKNEDSSAEQLNYIPLTKSEYQTIEKQWQAQLPGWEK